MHRSKKSMENNMESLTALLKLLLDAFNGRRSSQENEELHKKLNDLLKARSSSFEDRATIQNLLFLLEQCIAAQNSQKSELLEVVKEKEAFKSQVDELSRKMEELMKDKESSSAKGDLSALAKVQLYEILEKFKQERRRQRYTEAPEPRLPWADDKKKPYRTRPEQHSGGAYGKFDRQNNSRYQDYGRRNDTFDMVDRRDCMPQYQKQYQRQPHHNESPQNNDFHKYSMPYHKSGGQYHNPGPQNFSPGESRGRFQQFGSRGGKQMGSYNRIGTEGSNFSRGDCSTANQARYENKQFHHGDNSNRRGFQDHGQFHNRGQGRGQFRGRGNFPNRGAFQQNRGQTQNKEDGEKSEQKIDSSGISQKELEMLFLQFQQQQQQEAQKKNQENKDKSTFKKKRKSRNKKKAEPNAQVNEKESEEDSSDDSDSDGEASSGAASDNKGVKKKTSKCDEAAKEHDSTAFEMFKASDFDMSLAVELNPRKVLKDVMMIARKGDEIVSFAPKNLKELLNFKEEHPNVQTVILQKK